MTRAAPAPPRLFRNALVVTQDASRRVLRTDVRVEAGRFTHVGPHAPTEGAEVVDAEGTALVPGFVNLHAHVAMHPLRGIADDRDLAGFLETLFAVDAHRTEVDVEAGARAGIAEMLLGGTDLLPRSVPISRTRSRGRSSTSGRADSWGGPCSTPR